jgi:propionate CoA-transferase
MSKVITAEQAAALIGDGVTIGASTQGMSGWAEEVAIAIEKRFLESGHPRDITLVHSCTCGDYKQRGTTHLGHEGLTRRLVCGHTLTSPNMIRLIEENKIECYLLPQGVICQLWRAIAGKKVGVITSVGLGTYVDPRIDGGKVTPLTSEDLVKLVEIEGRELLLYKPFPIHVALIRGTVADENGNLNMDNEPVIMEALPLAMAAKNSGGIVIAQAHDLAEAHTLHPKNVKVPGALVDYVVIARPENHHQTQARPTTARRSRGTSGSRSTASPPSRSTPGRSSGAGRPWNSPPATSSTSAWGSPPSSPARWPRRGRASASPSPRNWGSSAGSPRSTSISAGLTTPRR